MKNITHFAAVSVLAALFGMAFATPANADVLSFNNLNATTAGTDPLATYGPIAGSFSTSNYGTTLTQVSLKLTGTADSGSLAVRLLSDASTLPGSVLTTVGILNDSLLSSTLSNYTFTLATPSGLAANTRYWIQLTSNASSASWAWSEDRSGAGVAGESIANANGKFANAVEAPYQMQVLTAAPEPSSLAILGLGLLGVAGVVRKRYSA